MRDSIWVYEEPESQNALNTETANISNHLPQSAPEDFCFYSQEDEPNHKTVYQVIHC